MVALRWFFLLVVRDVLSHIFDYLFVAVWGLVSLGDMVVTGSEWLTLVFLVVFVRVLELVFSGRARREWKRDIDLKAGSIIARAVIEQANK
jgi:hypothetical protein